MTHWFCFGKRASAAIFKVGRGAGGTPIGIKLRATRVAPEGFATPILGRIMLKSRCWFCFLHCYAAKNAGDTPAESNGGQCCAAKARVAHPLRALGSNFEYSNAQVFTR